MVLCGPGLDLGTQLPAPSLVTREMFLELGTVAVGTDVDALLDAAHVGDGSGQVWLGVVES